MLSCDVVLLVNQRVVFIVESLHVIAGTLIFILVLFGLNSTLMTCI